MIITGGIGLAPLRPLLDALLARRDRVARIHLAYGARTPADRLFTDELDGSPRAGSSTSPRPSTVPARSGWAGSAW